jgi:outer membrane protein assembly factor BamB
MAMKNNYFIIVLLLSLCFICLLSGQTIVNVPSDVRPSEGNLNTAIQTAIASGTLSNTIFNLEQGGYYVLTGTVTVPVGTHLTITAPAPGSTQNTAPPQIVWTSSGAVSTQFNFDCFGDITLKNVWLMYANTNGTQQATSLQIEDNAVANSNGNGEICEFDGVLFDYSSTPFNASGAVGVTAQHFKGTFKNCYFKNCTDKHLRYYGRALSFPYSTTGWHSESVMFENCTFANMGWVYQQDGGNYADYVKFNHCTFLNVMMFPIESGAWHKLAVTNSIFVNTYMFGDIPAARGSGLFGEQYGGTIKIDSVSAFGFSVPFTDADRRILFANSSYYIEKWLSDWMNENPYSLSLHNSSRDSEIPVPMPMLNPGTLRFFDSTANGLKVFPFMNRASLYDATNPGFILAPTNINNIKSFLLKKWTDNTDINWAYDPQSDVNQTWPINENLSYTNNTLKNAGMSGFPLGDLYHWWPAQYTSWKAQEAAENATISQLLNTGTMNGATTTPTITSFSPTSGPIGTTVAITGANFNPTPTNNVVYFGAVKAQVISSSRTLLTVTVPIGATYQPITITDITKGLTAYSAKPFIVTFPSSRIINTNSIASQVDFIAGLVVDGVVICDLDGDDKPDLVVWNPVDGTISIFRNTSTSGSITTGSFAPAVNFTTGNSPNKIAVGDIDGDGKPDLVVTNETSNTVSIFRNTSTPGSITTSSFAPKVDFTTGTVPICVAIADLDGDGKPDLVVANNMSTISIFRNTSISGSITASSFASKVDLIMTGAYPIRVVISDIDGDGKPDLVTEDFSNKTFSVSRNLCSTGTISFAPKVDFTTGVDPKDIALGDIDGDGIPDVVVTNVNDNTVSAFRNTSVSGSITASSFAPGVRFTTGNCPNNVAIGDVDGDGKPDLVIANVFGYTVSVLKNTSISGSITASSFASKVDITTSPGSTPYYVSVGDVDGDGRPDIVVANSSNHSISILRNTMDGSSPHPTITSFTPTRNALNVARNTNISITFDQDINQSTLSNSTIKINGSLSGLYTGTFNYNSSTKTTTITPNTQFKVGELVTITATRGIKSTTGNSLQKSNSWCFTIKTITSPGLFQANSPVPAGNTPWYITAADLDGNGTMDMAVTNSSSGDISILKNNGGGTFTQSSLVSVGSDPRAIVALDMDGDGDMDLATANWGSNTVSILKNNGSGTFIVSSSISVGSNPAAVKCADIDGDGDVDLIVTNWSSGTVSILINDGAGNFTISSTVNVGVNPAWVQFADFNNDGVMDFAVSNYGSGTVLIFCNNGQGTFIQTSSISVGTHPGAMNVLDVDGDGAMDLAVAAVDAGTISIYKNNGSGSFTYYSVVSVGSQPSSVMAADLDGDGAVDLAVSNNYSNSLSILKNNGTGIFTQISTIAVGSYPISVVAVDMDGDGALDIAVTNSQSNNLSILMNSASSNHSLITFQKTYGGAADEDIGNLIETPDGGYVAVGNTKSCTQTVADLCIFKTDKSGNLQWAKSYGDNGTGNVNIAATEDGYIIAGTVQVPGNGYDILVTRTDTGGNILWKKTFGGAQDDYGNAIYRMKNGEYVILGYTLNYGAGGWDAFAMRITGNGTVVWFKTYGTNATDLVNRLVEESDGSIVMTGTTYISGTHNMLLLKTDFSGNLLWAKQYNYPGDESGYGIARASNGDYLIVTCAYMSSIDGNVLLYRTTPEGILRWSKLYRDTHFPGKTYFAGFDVAALPDGNILLAGEWAGTSQENQCDGLFLKVDSIGSVLSSKTFGGSGTDFFRKLLLTSDGGYLLGGKTNSQGAGGFDIFLVKTDTEGNSGTSTNILPEYTSPIINESSVSLSTSAYTITGQFSQFSRSGNACWNSLPLSGISVTPSCNALNIIQNSNITATFSSNIDSSTFTNSTVKINGSLSGLHPCTLSYNSGTRTLLITPITSFKLGECVTVTLTRGIKNIAGESFASSYSWDFTIKTYPSSGLYQWKSTVEVGTNPFYLAAGDFEKDGSMDLAVVNNFSNSVSILKNNGSGSFTISSTIPVGNRPGSITAADLDGDGYMDLAVTNCGSGTVSILKNNKDGTFAQTSLASGGSAPWEIIAVDVNGDGALDLAVTNFSSNNVTILMNNGSGVFTLSSTIGVGTSPYSITASDWDGDGIRDLAITNFGSNSFSILKNNGNGIFTPTTFAAGSGPLSATAMDVNADGAIDLAVSNNNSNSISLFENNRSVVLTQTSTVTVGGHPAFKTPIDIDGDGDMDLIVPSADSISLLVNNGNGTFTQKTLFGAGIGSGYRMIIAADLDGDGIIELAGENNNSNSVSIFKVRSKNASVRLSSSLLSFGSIAAGTSKNLSLKIYNDGTDSSLFINNIVSSSHGFTINKTSLTIPPLGNDSILITFSPAASGTAFIDSLNISSNAVGNSNVYVALRGTSTFKSPRVVFSTNVGGPVYAGISIIADNAMYAIASGDAIYRMNTSGSIAYSLQVAGDVRSASSIAYDNTVYIASSDRNLYAFSKDGNSAWSPLPTGGVLTATPAIDSAANRLYIGVSNHNFIAVNRSTGSVAWNYFADDQIKNSAVITGDRKLVFATQKGTLYGFNLKKLSLPAAPTWQFTLPDTAPSSFAVDKKGNIYFGTGSGILLKVALPDNKQPEIIWQTLIGHSIVGAPVIDANGILYVGSTDSKLYAVDISTGAVKWSFATSGPIQSTPTISNRGKIFVANDSGEVYCLDSVKVIQWYYKTNAAIVSHLLYYKSILFFGTLGNKVLALYDSSQSSVLSKTSSTVEVPAEPMWSTFQGDGQRTGTSSASSVTGVGNDNKGIPEDFALLQNYPNPFNPSTVIAYELPISGKVSIKVFNMLGQQIVILADGFQSAGYHEVTFDTKSFPSGIYFYQMTAGSFVQTKKMVFMK